MTDTVFALSTLLGKSGVAIVRISGSGAKKVLRDFGILKDISHGRFIFAKLFHPLTKSHLDDALVLYFMAPNSFTGEDTVEFHLHGSIAVVKGVISALGEMRYLRPALPGEFSKKAFLNGKIDLTKADALVNLINAETDIQKEVALRQLSGQLENLYESWRGKIISILSKLEALIDFPEDDLPQDIIKNVMSDILTIADSIAKHLKTSVYGEVVVRGVKIGIIGAPNVGKSSLLNFLAKKEMAIVSNIAGTTRDVIEVKVDFDGMPAIFYDTAGIRDTEDVIELEGVKRAKKVSEGSDINIYVFDVTNPESYKIMSGRDDPNTIMVENKIDLGSCSLDKSIQISIETGEGLSRLLAILKELISELYTPSHDPVITSERYKIHLTKCLDFLHRFSSDYNLEIATEYIRLAAIELGSITGKIEVEEVLDEIFSSFCIGK